MAQSLGLNLLAKVLTDNRLSDFYLLRGDYFYDEEREIYDWIEAHVHRHGSLPSMDFTARRVGIEEPDSTDAYGVWFNEYIERAIYNRFSDTMPNIQQALNARRATDALNLVTQFVEDTHSIRTHGSQDLVTASQVGEEVMAELRRLRVVHGLSGIPTGYPTLDRITHGFQNGDLILFAARPGIGKSTVMMRMARFAHAAGYVPLFISMEMTRVQIMMRMFAEMAGVDMNALQTGELTTASEGRLVQIVQNVENRHPFYIIEGQFRKDINEIASVVNSLRPNIIFIDGAYLLRLPNAGRMAKWEIVGEIAQSLKTLGMVNQIPVIASFQITREGGKKRGDAGLEHLQLSDALGQLASLIVGIFDDEETDDSLLSTERRMKVLKGRAGERGQWFINWIWSPQMDMTEKEDEFANTDITDEDLDNE